MSIMTLLPLIFTLGPRMMDQPLSGTIPIVGGGAGEGEEHTEKPKLALEVSSGKVIAHTVSSKFTRMRLLTQGREADIGESITAVPLEYPQPFMSVESVISLLSEILGSKYYSLITF